MKDIRSAENYFDFCWYFISFSNCIAHLQPSNMVRLETTFILRNYSNCKTKYCAWFSLYIFVKFFDAFHLILIKIQAFSFSPEASQLLCGKSFLHQFFKVEIGFSIGYTRICRVSAWSLEFGYWTIPFLAIYRLCGIDFLFIKNHVFLWKSWICDVKNVLPVLDVCKK